MKNSQIIRNAAFALALVSAGSSFAADAPNTPAKVQERATVRVQEQNATQTMTQQRTQTRMQDGNGEQHREMHRERVQAGDRHNAGASRPR